MFMFLNIFSRSITYRVHFLYFLDSGMNGDLSNDTQDSSTSHDTADLRPDEDSVDSDKALNLVSIYLLPDIYVWSYRYTLSYIIQ